MQRLHRTVLGIMSSFVVVLLIGNSSATTYFVSVNGMDENPGNAGRPFKTIQKAANTAGPGDRIVIRAGVYYERVKIVNSGTATQPIEFVGERDSQGEWKTILDGSEPVSGWRPAPERGYGVFKTNTIPYKSMCMIADTDRDIPNAEKSDGTGHDAFNYIGQSPDWEVQPSYAYYKPVKFWDGLEALYHWRKGTTYIRFRNGENPAQHNVRSSPAGAGFLFSDCRYVRIRNLKIRGAQKTVQMIGKTTSHIVVDSCHLMNGETRVTLHHGVSHCTISNNKMEMGRLPGKYTWCANTGGSLYKHGVGQRLYAFYKSIAGPYTGDDDDESAIEINGAGIGNEIRGNEIFEVEVAIMIEAYQNDVQRDLVIRQNLIRNAHAGIYVFPAIQGLRIHHNVIHDVNMHVRIMSLDRPEKRTLFVYANVFHNPWGAGQLNYFHYRGNATNTPSRSTTEMWWYHNSFQGSRYGLNLSHLVAASDCPLDKSYFINNVFSVPKLYRNPYKLGLVDYNHVCGDSTVRYESYVLENNPSVWTKDSRQWKGSNNTYRRGMYWSDGENPQTGFQPKSDLMKKGLDLSKPFSAGGKTFAALPGMDLDYYGVGTVAPTLGAVQAKSTGIRETRIPGSGSNGRMSLHNPQCGRVVIRFFSRSRGPADLRIVNPLGQTVHAWVCRDLAPGFHTVTWGKTNRAGMPVPAGVYLCRLQNGSGFVNRKILMPK